MAIKNILGSKETPNAGNKDEEVQKLREKFNTIVNTEAKTGEEQPKQPGTGVKPAEPEKPQKEAGYQYVDPDKAEENERITSLIMQQIKELIEIDNNLNSKNKELETNIGENAATLAATKGMVEQFNSRLELIEKNMEKFMGLYEVVTNRFNPFVSEDDSMISTEQAKAVSESIKIEKPEPKVVEQEAKQIIEHADIKKLPKEQETIIEDELKEAIADIRPQVVENSKEDISVHITETVKKEVKNADEHQMKLSNEQLKSAMHGMLKETVAHIKETLPPVAEVKAAEKKPEEEVKELHPDFHFKLPDGTEIKSIIDLKDSLKTMDDSVFATHVNEEKNDFAEWIRVALQKNEIADKVALQKTREGIQKALEGL